MRRLWIALLPAILFLLPAGAAAAGPELSLSPAPVSFEKTTVGEESAVVSIEVANLGDAGDSLEATSLEGGDSGDFKLNGSDCGWIEAGGHCTVWVRFAPQSPGTKNAALVLRLKGGAEASVALGADAVLPHLVLAPDPLDFGIQRVNQSRSEGMQVSNGGEAGTRIGSVNTEGRDTGNFWVSQNDCFGGRWLAPGESCWLGVNFNPWQIADYEAQVTVYADNVPFTAEVRGTGGDALLAPASNPVEFGAAAVGGEGVVRTIHLRNEGNLAGAYFIAVVAGGDVASFELVDESCTGEAIDPGAGCIAHVRFDPVGVGLKAARLAMFGDSGGGTMVILRGEGEPPAPEGTFGFPPAPHPPKPVRRKGRAFARGAALRRPCKGIRVCNRAKVFQARRAIAR